MLPLATRRIAIACTLLVCWLAVAQTGDDFSAIAHSANAARQAGNTDQAIRDYKRALSLRPDWAEGWWDVGMTQYENNQYADAITSLRKLTELAPRLAPAWDILGLSEFETGNYDTALANLEKAQTLGGVDDPDIAQVSAYHLALLMIRAGNFESATQLLAATFGSSPPSQAKAALGLALLRVPLLPSEIDPSRDALIQAAGDAASDPDPKALDVLIQQYPNVPWLHYAYGLVLAKAGETQQAMEQQKIEATISPESVLPWIEISKLSLSLNHAQEAANAAQHAIKLNGQSVEAHDALAKALAASGQPQRAATELPEAERLPQSAFRDPRMIALYEAHSASAAAPESSETWAAAMQDYSQGHYEGSIAALKTWVEQNPGDGTAWAVMGLSEYALKDYDNARIHLQRGINLGLKGDAASVQLANNRLATLLIRDSQFSAATTILSSLAGKPPMAEQTRLALGLALLHIATPPDALDTAQRNLAQSAGSIVELLLASRYADAFPAFQKLIAEHPTTPWLHYAYGDALDSLSQYDEAKKQMQAEVKLSPKSPLPWIRIASIDVRQHLPGDAVQAAQTAVSLAPDSAEAHYELGRAWLEDGEAQTAIAELEKANGIKPDNPEIHFVLARAYTKTNQPEKAEAERETFMQLKEIANQKDVQDASGRSILQANSQ